MSEIDKRHTMPPEEAAGTSAVPTDGEQSYGDRMRDKLKRARETRADMGSRDAKRHTVPAEEAAGTGSVPTDGELSYGDRMREKLIRARSKAEQRSR